MNEDPISRLAKLRIVRLSQELEVLLADKKGGNIVVEIVNRLRDRAAESMTALTTCNATDRNAMMILQNEVKRYDEFLGCLSNIASEGIAFDKEFSSEDREDLIDILSQTEDGRKEAYDLGLLDDA